MRVRDGRSNGDSNQIVVGESYIMKLVHTVSMKTHFRRTGVFSLITKQPVVGRSKSGGQRIGEMEMWRIQSFGAFGILSEILAIKSEPE